MERKAVAVVGPTAVGKTRLGVYLAAKLGGEVVNGDAAQIYRGLTIGTAKITPEECKGIAHHLLDIRNPSESYTVADYQQDARRVINQMFDEKKIPVIVGGTGLYIKAALYNYQFPSVQTNRAYRRLLEDRMDQQGPESLYHELCALDPQAAAKIHPHNLVRVMRTLEIIHGSGAPLSRQTAEDARPFYHSVVIGLTMPRDVLYHRINQRVDRMMERGLLSEVRSLYQAGFAGFQALQAIGYKEFFPYFEGKMTLDRAIEKLKQNSRHYAKRQYTWFRRQMNVQWFDMGPGEDSFPEKAAEILDYVRLHLNNITV